MNGREPVGWERAGCRSPRPSIVPTQELIVHAHRRRRALDRLEGLTTGLTVAGVAGTAGFAILAAASWSGVPGAQTVKDLPAVVGNVGDGVERAVVRRFRVRRLRRRSAARRPEPRPRRPERGNGSGGSNGTQIAPTGPARPAAVRSRHDGRLRLAAVEHDTGAIRHIGPASAIDIRPGPFVTSGPGADRWRRRPWSGHASAWLRPLPAGAFHDTDWDGERDARSTRSPVLGTPADPPGRDPAPGSLRRDRRHPRWPTPGASGRWSSSGSVSRSSRAGPGTRSSERSSSR